ncbi:MAG: hypothetical protein DRI34_03325 [Deltaproteobacteria bacterium]|nr:MAG: hypothetical protein DRI34_03325 [Deltaproteobacteria bacterium]
MNTLPARCPILLAGWDPLEFVHHMDWYRRLLRAEWFRPLRPYWLNYHLDWVAAALLLLLLFLLLRALWRLLLPKRSGSRLAARAARQYEKNGELGLAAEAWRRAERPQRAYDLYLRQGKLHAAAELAEQLGKIDKAIEHLSEAGDLAEAAAVAERADRLEQAAELHLQRQEPLAAARLFDKLDQKVRAGECYREAGMWRRAAEAFFSAGDEEEAVQALLKLSAWSGSEVTEEESVLFERGAARCEKEGRHAEAGRLYQAAGRNQLAATAFLAAGDKLQAARLLEKCGEQTRAAELYRELERKDDWLRLAEQATRSRGDPAERAGLLEQAGKTIEAAAAYLQAGHRDQAIRLYREHDPAEAARLLAEDGRHLEAARAYLQGGDPAAAHEQARLAGDLSLAAQAAEQAGLHLEAALALIELGQTMKAATHLQQVPADHPRFRDASSLLASSLWQLGEKDLARKAAERATAGLEPTPDNLELFYRQARILEQAGDPDSLHRALEIYDTIVTLRIDFRDARQRRTELKNVLRGSADKPPG